MSTLTLLQLVQYLFIIPLPFQAPEREALLHYARTGDPSRCVATWQVLEKDMTRLRIHPIVRGAQRKALALSQLDWLERGGAGPDHPDRLVLLRRVQTIEKRALLDYRCLLGECLRRNVFRLSRRSVELGRLLLWQRSSPYQP